jgi:predicted alpha/beta-fold hydrolase
LQPFVPLFSNPHLLTVAGNFWPRPLDERRFPVEVRLYRTEPDVQILAHEQRPGADPAGDIVLVHGLEGSSCAGYMKSMAQAALEAGFATHRLNLRSCGGTEALCPTAYHSGLTSDLLVVVRELVRAGGRPVYAVGFSLGGNIVLKLAGELGEDARPLIAGVCAISTPIDLAACVRKLEERQNRIYELRFLFGLKQRIRTKHRLAPHLFSLDGLGAVRSVREFDDRFTAPAFKFIGADHYYATQSSIRFISRISVPALLIQSKDDPLIPFEIFEQAEIFRNPLVKLLAVEHGGHLGFLSRRPPRFWCDRTVMDWIRTGKSQ